MLTPEVEVLVVGAGPTGLMLAAQLARYGVPFRLIDHRAGPFSLSRATTVQARTLELFDQLGLADADDPNDNHRDGHIDFDFSSFGPGAVTVTSLEVYDVSHTGATVTLYADGERIEEIAVPHGGTGERATVEVDTPGVDLVRVTVRDSFAVDNLVFKVQ